MNLGIVQPQLSLARRANNLSKLKHLVREAAEQTPAPDLLVLPDCCVSIQETHVPGDVTIAMCQGFAEAFAWWAREWGIWIAVGHSVWSESGLTEAATLFDPDGDPFIRAIASGNDAPADSKPWVVRNTPIGRIALRATNATNGKSLQPVSTDHPLDLIIEPAIAPSRPTVAKLAAEHTCFTVSTGFASDRDDCDAQSFVADREGQFLIETVPGASSIVFAPIETNPPTKSDDDNWEDVDLGGRGFGRTWIGEDMKPGE